MIDLHSQLEKLERDMESAVRILKFIHNESSMVIPDRAASRLAMEAHHLRGDLLWLIEDRLPRLRILISELRAMQSSKEDV